MHLPLAFSTQPEYLIAGLSATTLILGIPFLLVPAPAVIYASYVRRRTSFPVSQVFYMLSTLAICLVSDLDTRVLQILSSLVMVIAVGGAFLVPGW